MKKLLIAMTAAAVGFGAWADGEQTLLNETFEANWTLTGNAWWTYSAEAAEGELTLLDTGKLKLNTGSKVLNAKFAASAQQIPANGYLFNSQVKFTDPSDTIPELGQYDKFALVVLDNIDSVELAAKAGKTVENTTNLFVIAGYGTDGMRAYMLSPAEGIANLDSEWLARDHIIKVKAYADAIDSADETRAGFRVMVDGYICKVLASYAIVDDVIDFTDSIDADGSKDSLETSYLGRVKADFVAGIRKWYNAKELLIANCLGNTLASVDFQGQGTIDDVSLAVAGNEFGPESTVVTFSGYSADAIATITYGGENVTDGEYTITGNENFGDTVEIVVTLKSGYALKAGNDTYTVSYTFSEATATASKTITLDVFEIKAYANGVAQPSFDDALTAVTSAGGTIELADDVDDSVEIVPNVVVQLDLNGKTVADIYNRGTLTIMDSSNDKTGTVKTITVEGCGEVSVDNEGTLIILGGNFEGLILGAEEKSIFGGKFKVKPDVSALKDGLTFSEKDDNDYYSVVPASNYPESDEKVVYDENLSADEKEKQKAAVELTFDAIADASDIKDDDTAVTTYINTVYGNSVPADALIGANNVDISVKFSLPLMKEDPVVKFVAEAAEADEAAAFTFQIKEGDAGNAVAIKAALAKVYEMIRYSADLNGLDAGVVDANNGNVECTISADMKSVKVSFKSGDGKPSKGFMKVKLR